MDPDSGPQKSYTRGAGVANEAGTGFEYKMALLTYLRAQRLTKKFWIGVNAEHVGAFDDIVLIYMYGDVMYQLLIQLKHKVENKLINRNAFKAEKGAFGLNKYFVSVEEKLNSNDFERTNFVVFTNATLKEPLPTDVKLNPLAKEFLSTGGNQGVIYRVESNSDMCELFNGKEGADDFINKLVICCCQANVHQLDDIIKQEILLQFRRIIPNLNALYAALLDEVKAWWELTGTTDYLTETWSVWKTVAPGSSLLNRIRFSESEIANLMAVLDNPKIHLFFPKVDVQLRSLKLLQALQERGNLSFIFVKLDDILNSDDDDDDNGSLKDRSVVKLWQDGKFDLLAVDTYTESEYKGDKNKLLEELVNLADENKKLLLVSDGTLTTQLGEEWFRKEDKCVLNQLNEPSKRLVVEELWRRSRNTTDVLSRDERGELLSMFLSFENGTASLLADRNGSTPLQLAVEKQNLNLVELLLDLGSDTAAANSAGDTPLLIACRKPSSEIVKILLEHGALTTAADFHGDSPLIISVRNGYTDTAKLLLEHKASTKAADKFGCTALQIAAAKPSSEIVALLLKHGASTRGADLDGNTALHFAVKSKDYEAAKSLLDYGARTNVADIDGVTPLLIAEKEGSRDIVRLLLEHETSTAAATM